MDHMDNLENIQIDQLDHSIIEMDAYSEDELYERPNVGVNLENIAVKSPLDQPKDLPQQIAAPIATTQEVAVKDVSAA